MRAKNLTESQIEFIKAHRLKMSSKRIALHLGVHRDMVIRYLRRNGLAVPKEIYEKFRIEGMKGRTTSTPEIDQLFKEKYLTVNVNQLSKLIGRSEMFVKTRLRQLGLTIPAHIVEKRKLEGRIKPGTVPPNKGKKQCEYMSKEAIERTKKTRFKKGDLPANTRERDGVISVRRDKSGIHYQYVRISVGKWVPLHQFLWEQEHGKYDGRKYCLWFIDGNTMNVTLENLELITRAENMSRNTIARYPGNVRRIMKLNKKLKNLINAKDRSGNSKETQ